MIVGSCFEGDDTNLAWKQQDVYHQALRIIIDSAITMYRVACFIADFKIPESGWPHDPSIDHRTIQDAHDCLAAVWRFNFSPPEGMLFLSLIDPNELTMESWLAWLSAEMRRWDRDEPDMVRQIIRIFRHQNEEIGYEAGHWLKLYLYQHYTELPWLRPYE